MHHETSAAPQTYEQQLDTAYSLMERLGMRREAHFREHARFKGHWDEEFVYAILASEWRGGA